MTGLTPFRWLSLATIAEKFPKNKRRNQTKLHRASNWTKLDVFSPQSAHSPWGRLEVIPRACSSISKETIPKEQVGSLCSRPAANQMQTQVSELGRPKSLNLSWHIHNIQARSSCLMPAMTVATIKIRVMNTTQHLIAYCQINTINYPYFICGSLALSICSLSCMTGTGLSPLQLWA